MSWPPVVDAASTGFVSWFAAVSATTWGGRAAPMSKPTRPHTVPPLVIRRAGTSRRIDWPTPDRSRKLALDSPTSTVTARLPAATVGVIRLAFAAPVPAVKAPSARAGEGAPTVRVTRAQRAPTAMMPTRSGAVFVPRMAKCAEPPERPAPERRSIATLVGRSPCARAGLYRHPRGRLSLFLTDQPTAEVLRRRSAPRGGAGVVNRAGV